jgi:hypothetical protein
MSGVAKSGSRRCAAFLLPDRLVDQHIGNRHAAGGLLAQ